MNTKLRLLAVTCSLALAACPVAGPMGIMGATGPTGDGTAGATGATGAGERGATGATGAQGPAGTPCDTTALTNLETAMTTLQSTVAAQQTTIASLGTRLSTLEANLCPAGWAVTAETGFSGTLCTKTVSGFTDEMVKVGDFWIDRFEMSTCGNRSDGLETGYGTTSVACSVRNVTPKASITWFQAAQMCANAGKKLCTNQEWQIAASGTPDPGAHGGATGCNVDGTGGTPAPTMSHSACVSSFGAYDMIGNVWEWTSDWHGANGSGNSVATSSTYGSDGMWGVLAASNGNAGAMPAAGLRGGYWFSGTLAGAFAMSWDIAPLLADPTIGARCCAGGG